VTDEDRRQRNIRIAALIGGFLLPLAGLVGAALFYAREERDMAWRVLVASILGIVFYLLLFTA
jgi:uncharacterized membrane protein HdeD (DUF308 family)